MAERIRHAIGFLEGGGDTPSPTPKIVVISVWANQECTVKPSSWEHDLYIKVEKPIEEDVFWHNVGDGSYMEITEGIAYLWVDWMSEFTFNYPIDVGTIIPVYLGSYDRFDISGYHTDFYSDGTSGSPIE